MWEHGIQTLETKIQFHFPVPRTQFRKFSGSPNPIPEIFRFSEPFLDIFATFWVSYKRPKTRNNHSLGWFSGRRWNHKLVVNCYPLEPQEYTHGGTLRENFSILVEPCQIQCITFNKTKCRCTIVWILLYNKHTGCDFSDDQKLFFSKEFEDVSVVNFCDVWGRRL